MSTTTIGDLEAQVKEYWSDIFVPELKESDLLVNLISRDYEGEIKEGGDQVKVTQWQDAKGEIHTVGVDDGTFNPEKMKANQIFIKADKIFSASFEFTSIAQLQSQLTSADSAIRTALLNGVKKQMNNYLYSLVAPASAKGTVTDFNASEISSLRKFAGQKKWSKDGEWYILPDSSYYSDLLNAQTLTSSDNVNDRPTVAGEIGTKRFGFNIFEDNSDGLLTVIDAVGGTDTEDVALAFHKQFLHLALQTEASFEVASLTGNKQRGFVIKVDIVGGAKAGHDFEDLHQVVFNT